MTIKVKYLTLKSNKALKKKRIIWQQLCFSIRPTYNKLPAIKLAR